MNYKTAAAKDAGYVFPTYKRLPLLLARGRGVYVYDQDGNRYLDMLGGLAVNALGHTHPALTAAAAKQMKILSHVSNLYMTEPMLNLAERLCRLSGMGKTFFGNSGAEANEAAIKLARKYFRVVAKQKRHEIITLKRSFHGRTLATITATGQDFYQENFDPLMPGFKYAELNDLASVEKLITKKTAAIMVEPVQGESGIWPCTRGFLRGLAGLRRKHGVLLIFDEVQCGLGRTGKWFAFEHFGVKPDIVTLAKPLAGGLPMGAMLSNDRVAKGFPPGSHASTFGAGPVPAATALAFLDVVEKQNLLEHVTEMGEYLKAGLNGISGRTGNITDIRGMGLMMAVDIEGSAPDALAFLQKEGILVNAIGAHTLRILPPFIITRRHADTFLKSLEKFLAAQA